MVKVSIKISAVDSSNKTNTDTVSYVNPEATNEQLTEFAQALIALTDDTYMGTKKITEEAIG